MDLNIAIHRIYPDAKYRLSKSDPPHKIIQWEDLRPQPSEADLLQEWEKYQQETNAKSAEDDFIKNNGTAYHAIVDGQRVEIILLPKGTIII
jgi:hypothetical protein